MNILKNPKDSEETIFLQAIDQIYENNKNYSDFSEDESNEDYENGEIKINFDFIEPSDEIFLRAKSLKINNKENLSNSSLSSESTEFDHVREKRFYSLNFLTESKVKSTKIKDILSDKFNENTNKSIRKEAFKIKENLKENYKNSLRNNFEMTSDKMHTSTPGKIRVSENVQNFVFNNSNNTINNFNFNYNINYSNQQNFNCKNFYGIPQQININNLNMNMVCNNFQHGFFQQTQGISNNNLNVNIESSFLGLNVNRRKFSYPSNYIN